MSSHLYCCLKTCVWQCTQKSTAVQRCLHTLVTPQIGLCSSFLVQRGQRPLLARGGPRRTADGPRLRRRLHRPTRQDPPQVLSAVEGNSNSAARPHCGLGIRDRRMQRRFGRILLASTLCQLEPVSRNIPCICISSPNHRARPIYSPTQYDEPIILSFPLGRRE